MSFVVIKVLCGAYASLPTVLVATSSLYGCAKYQDSVGAIQNSSQIIYTGGARSPNLRELVGGNYPSRQRSNLHTDIEDNFDKDVSFVAIKVLRGAFATISIVLVATSSLHDCAKYQSSVGAIHSSQIIYTGGHLSPIPRELVGGNYPSRQKSLPTTIESNYLKE